MQSLSSPFWRFDMNIAIDTETRLFSPGYMAPKVICLSVATEKENYLLHHQDAVFKMEQIFKDVLNKKYNYIIGHNIAYDMACIYESYPTQIVRSLIWELYDKKLVQCTLCREKLIDLAQGKLKHLRDYSLAKLSKKYLDKTLDKDTWRLRYSELESVPLEEWPEGAREYALEDARVTYDIFEKQEAPYEIFDQEAARQASYAFALQLTKCRGMVLDADKVQEMSESIQAQMQVHHDIAEKFDLWHVSGKKKQANTKRLRELIQQSYPHKKIPYTNPSKKYPNGQMRTADAVLKECDNDGLRAYLEYKKLEKLRSTYIKPFVEAGKQPIHPSYDPIKDTGRTSSFGPNIQNQPRKGDVRECFIPRPGWVFIFCDYDSQEVRTLAESCFRMGLDSVLGKRYKEDPAFDPHTYFAAQIMQISFEEALELKKKKDTLLLERRQQAKAANFGFPGGLGAKTFIKFAEGYGVYLTLEEARDLRDNWFKTWAEMTQYFNIISNITKFGVGDVTQLLSGRVRGQCTFTQAANTFFQGLASDVSKYALYQVAQKCFDLPGTSALVGCRPIAFIHDEIGIEAPQEYAEEAARELEKTMIESMNELCIHVPAGASANIMTRWSKDEKYWL
jgi:DNA polymerase I-like protein with 3'-5' exonuclease and polymerase domains